MQNKAAERMFKGGNAQCGNNGWTGLRQESAILKKNWRHLIKVKLTGKAYKGFSGGFGSYAQRDPAKNMLRLRLPAAG